MRNSTLLFALLIAFSVSVWGETATNNCSSALSASYTDVESGKAIEWKTSKTNTYSSPIRVYSGDIITFHCKDGAEKITKIVITASESSYGTATKNGTWSTTGGSVSNKAVSGTTVTITLSGTATAVTYTKSEQVRWSTVEITYTASSGGGGGGGSSSCSYDLSTNSYASQSSAKVTWNSDANATMTLEKGESSTNANSYIPNTRTSTRFYTSQVLTITPKSGKTLSSIVFTATDDGYAEKLRDSWWENATASSSGTTVTVTPENGAAAVSAEIGGTCGFTCVEFITGSSTPYTVTLSKNGVTSEITGCLGTYTLPTTGEHVTAPCEGWAWHCWTNAPYSTATTAPSSTVINTMSSEGTAYAVYKQTATSGGSSTSTLDASAQGWSNGGNVSNKTIDEVTYSFSKNGGTAPAYYTSGGIRIYANNKLTISSSATITAITFSYTQSKYNQDCVDEGTITSGNWSGSATSVVFTNKTDGQIRFSQIVVTMSGGTTTTYTSSPSCTTHTVTWSMDGDNSNTAEYATGASIVFPATATGCDGKTFMGWSAGPVEETDIEPTYTTSATMGNSDMIFYAVYADAEGGGGVASWAETAITALTGTDVFIMVGTNSSGDFALPNDASGSPSAISVTIADGKITSTVADNLKWNISGNSTDGYTFHPNGSTTTWLYSNTTANSGSNTNIRIGTGARKVWLYTSGNQLVTNDNNADRYLAVNGSSDFRGYITASTSKTTFKFYTYHAGTTYSGYTTSCGTCLPAPTSPVVVPKSNRATITWDAVPDATGYDVTCSGGTVEVDGTKATITGLTPNTSYTFTIRSQGGDPYACFPAYNGSFTTTECDDSPVFGTVTTTSTTATIPWTSEAATATIRIYTDEACNDQVGADHTSCTSPYTVTELTSNTTYYYKIWAGGSCVSAVGSFTTEELKLDIAEWKPDAVVVEYNGEGADLTLTTYIEEGHGDPHGKTADDIFFSKYFEAASNVKLLGIYNGTDHEEDLSNYEIWTDNNNTDGWAAKKSISTLFASYSVAPERAILPSKSELILISYQDQAADNAIIQCAQNDPASNFSTYVRLGQWLEFNGDDAVALVNPSGDLIDLIGAGTKSGGRCLTGGDTISTTSNNGDVKGFMDKPGGWYTANGYPIDDDGLEIGDGNYALSTNRCLLIRRNHVKSGHAAVALNTTKFVTLKDYAYDADDDGTPEDYAGEWKGVQIPGKTSAGGATASCNGFNEVGSYDYNSYYVDWNPDITSTTFGTYQSDPFDGTYVIPVTGLIDKACTHVRLELKEGDNLVISKDIKVPIMISEIGQYTTDAIFRSNYKDEDICRECDVVILGGATLTKVPDGTLGDISEVHDLKIYPGGKLVVPANTGTENYTYSVNSLSFRREEDVIASANILGDLIIRETDGVYLDMRVDPTNWHFFTLPYDCKVSDIRFADPNAAVSPVIGTDFLIMRYDGERRAATRNDQTWENVAADATLKKGLGYIYSLPGSGITKHELRFPMSNDVLASDKDASTVIGELYGYGCDDEELRPNHKGWNLIGAPYLMPYSTATVTTPLATGELEKDPTVDPWDGKWRIKPGTEGLRYIVEPIDNGWSGYQQVAIGGYKMQPFTCYFVQIGAADPANPDPTVAQGIEFTQGNVIRNIVRRAPKEYEEVEDTHPVWCAVELINPTGEKDETTLLISDDFTDNYDMMNDLVKMRGSYYTYYTHPVLASRNNEGEMAFNALPDASAEAGVSLNYFAATGGEFTIAYNDKYGREEVKSVMLLDKQTNTWYNLMAEPYSFTTNRIDNTDRFVLSVRVERKKAPQSITEIEEGTQTNGPRKLLIDGHVYILRGGQLFDITGKQVKQ